MPFEDLPEDQTQSGGVEAILCKCGAYSKVSDNDFYNRMTGVRHHLKTCSSPREECNEHGQIEDLKCGRCSAYLCSVLVLKEKDE